MPLLALLLLSLLACAPTTSPRAVTPLPSPTGPGAMAPRLLATGDGVWMSWLEPLDAEAKKAWAVRTARLEGEAWTAPSTVALSERLFVNWADFPALQAAGGELLVHRLEKLGEGTYAYGVFLSRSTDGGASWEERGLLHDDASESEHGFATLTSQGDAVLATWLDGRATVGGAAMQLRATRVEGGVAAPSALLDDAVCDCCTTAAAWTARGLAVAYRDRSAAEVRDIAFVRGEGETWTAPKTVHDDGWTIHGCPVNGPAIAADGERLAVAWFTAAQDRPRVQLAFSDDAGDHFDPPVEIDAVDPLGRVDLVLSGDGAIVSWLAAGSSDGEAEVRLRTVDRRGRTGATTLVAATRAERATGFPRLVRDGGRLLVAWVEAAPGEPSAVRLAALPLPG